MLPSKEKFQYYNCPFYAYDGSCDRPFCHFKHSEPPERQEDPRLEADEDDCPAGCVCFSQPVTPQQNGIQENGTGTATSSRPPEMEARATSVPQYRPTPIVELQKRSNNMENKLYSPDPAGSTSAASFTYNPSDRHMLEIKKEFEESSDAVPLSFAPVKKEPEEGLTIKTEPLFEWEANGCMPNVPVKVEFLPWQMIPIDTPSSPSIEDMLIKSEPVDELEASVALSATAAKYMPCTTKLTSGLEYNPSSNLDIPSKKIQLQYDPCKIESNCQLDAMASVATPAVSTATVASYVPTDKSKLSKSVEGKTSHSSSSKKHKTSHSHHSSKKRHREESPDSKKKEGKPKKLKIKTTETKKHSDKESSKKEEHKHKKEEKVKKHCSDSSKKVERNQRKSSSDSKSSKSHSRSHSKSRSGSTSAKAKENYHKKSSSKDKDHSKHSHNAKSSSTKKTKESAKENVETKSAETNASPPRVASPAALDSEDSGDNIMEECYNIFEQFQFDNILAESLKPAAENVTSTSTGEEIESVPSGGKKRIAYSGAAQAGSKPKLAKIIRPVSKSAGVMMAERWKKQQAELLTGNTGVNKLLNDLTGQPPTIPSTATSTKVETPQKTSAQSLGKGKPRVAHKVKEEMLQRPIVDAASGDRIPFPRRQHVLDKFVDACLKKYSTTEEAYEKAIELEQVCFVKSLSTAVYNNLFVSNMLKLKHSNDTKQVKGGNTHQQLEFSSDRGIVKKTVVNRDYNFRGVELYKRLTRYLLTEEQLKQYSYPMISENESEPGRASVFNIDKSRLATYTGPQRECTRCSVRFYVDKYGMPKELAKDELCIFHPKRAFPRKVRGCLEYYFACCELPMGAEGCETCKFHISEKLDVNNLHGFVQTFQKDGPSGVYALDCEMCITTEGSSLTRVTVIDDSSNVVYDTLVKPDKPILDYCTRYSGVDEKMLKDVTCTLRDVQGVLLHMFSKDTILIGHSLNSDLMVLKLIHSNVIDTSIVFPHREGPPKRRALKNVAKDYLFRLIQQEESGHDSKEDAVACMDLMKLKVKEAAKLE